MVWKANPLTKLPPQSISPLIRAFFSYDLTWGLFHKVEAGRWGALIVGITYGRMRYNYLAKKEEPIQLEADKWKAARKVRIAQEWKQFEEEQMADIRDEVAGHPPKVPHHMPDD